MGIKRAIGVGVIGVAGFATALFLWIWIAPCALGGCAPLSDLAQFQAEGSELLDVNGEPFARLATVNRRIISLDSLPPYVPQAVIAIEDQRFYEHHGIDFRRTVGALLSNLRAGSVEEGGSTITQQLARNLFPEALPYQERSLRRKILEARVARQLEREFSKDKILELYLNHIYLGSGAYGIEAASRTYFGKPAAELTLMEAATLAGLPQAPSEINPKESVELAAERRDLVLDRMVEAGFIDRDAAEEAKSEKIVVQESDGKTDRQGAYFVETVRRELEDVIGSRFYTDGLRIYTTFDGEIQAAAEESLSEQLEAIESGRYGRYRHPAYSASKDPGDSTPYLQGALVVLDVNNGEVRALIGGRDFADSKYNRATQARRQPGSAFKPFVYAAALMRYGSPAHEVQDSPIRLTLSNGQVWEPENYSGDYAGTVTMRDALTHSRNAATVHLAREIGIRSVINVAHGLGITTEIPELPSTALGAAEVRPIELVTAYAAFANGGERIEPHLIRKVVDRDGKVLWEAADRRDRTLDPAVAFVLTTMLEDVIDRGTGTAVRAAGFRGPAAGKTGTTNDASDAWFVGYTPELAAGVWIGLDEPATIVPGTSGGALAAPVWGRLMRKIYADRPTPEGWRMPPDVTTARVDASTGFAVSRWCAPTGPTYIEYFIHSTPRPQPCRRDLSPRYTYEDSLWTGDRWDYDDPGPPVATDPSLSPDIEWPELDELRQRIERARREAEQRLNEFDRRRRGDDDRLNNPPNDERDGRRGGRLDDAGRENPRDVNPSTSPRDDFGGRPSREDGRATQPSPSSAEDPAGQSGPDLLGVPVDQARRQ